MTTEVAAAPIESALTPLQSELLARADSIFASIGNVVSAASETAITAGQAVAREIPDIAIQYVMYGRVMASIWILLGIVSLYGAYQLFWRGAFLDVRGYTTADGRIVSGIMGIVSGAFGVGAILSTMRDFVLVWTAPKIWLITEMVALAGTIRGH